MSKPATVKTFEGKWYIAVDSTQKSINVPFAIKSWKVQVSPFFRTKTEALIWAKWNKYTIEN